MILTPFIIGGCANQTITETPTQKIQEAVDYTTYKGADKKPDGLLHKIQIRYPSPWHVEELGNDTVLFSQGYTSVLVAMRDISENPVELDEHLENSLVAIREEYQEVKVEESRKTSLNGMDARRIIFETESGKFIQTFAIEDNIFYMIHYSAINKQDYQKHLSIAQEMIQSFEIVL